MKSLQDVLREGDPLSGEPRLDVDDTRAMRRAVVAAADEAVVERPWRQAVLVAAMAALMLAVIATVARREPLATGSTLLEVPPVEMQFSTPGGTRVIWVFDQTGAE